MNKLSAHFNWNRVKSFLWHVGAVAAVAVVNYLATNVGLFDLPAWAVVVVGQGLAELTKVLNNWLSSNPLP